MIGHIKITNEEFMLISRLVYQKFGIKLSEKKRALVVNRLHKVLYLGKFHSFTEYYNYVIQEPSGRALLTLVDQISTNHTYFFREKDHFDYFTTEALPRITEILHKKNKKDLRIWCAGCSSGEEPYTLAMIISNYFSDTHLKINIGILATDISISALDKAKAGIYPADRLSQIPPVYRQRHFRPLSNGSWEVKQSLREMVLFRRLNLIRPDYPFKGLFQAVFCRNVMIYFDQTTQQALVERFHRYTEPGGYLFIGHSESIDRSSGLYKYVQPSIYQRI
ncbi:MAG: Chemotaxis protein methyltransferase Cher2 [Pelotomaculum sp. PtaU1.Bin035]|nr:MAG: Chemotaxis protein methyltransferase Cher2 [Pelotomaculum sp. PtaU1.Bin035]